MPLRFCFRIGEDLTPVSPLRQEVVLTVLRPRVPILPRERHLQAALEVIPTERTRKSEVYGSWLEAMAVAQAQASAALAEP